MDAGLKEKRRLKDRDEAEYVAEVADTGCKLAADKHELREATSRMNCSEALAAVNSQAETQSVSSTAREGLLGAMSGH